ncbi:hydrophobic/amphiphilic exporter-1, HAE1 family [Ruegeria halocynthiae]|uniref:Efflux pump membrane transporter n=1 Tax=Ruegeria halocynthiae TaxID=985054 RepID=A0A1H2WCB1_9RHOB|nr:efflux RND transporter permease subunit [Ruegeria halocynthiae]SDW77924.1 hydrophobic/amphiphilic exporter-1, HAE1 family [Ruegeria halocynthiae]
MISHYFINRPHFAAVVAILMVLFGAVCVRLIPISEYPDIAPPQIYVQASYPGADAQVIQESVAAPIEERVNGIEGMLYMQSKSSNDGSYDLSVSFELGTDPNVAAVEVQNRIALASAELPSEVQQQGIEVTKQSGNMILVINLTSPDESRDELYLSNYAAEFLHDPLQRLPGVGGVSQFGQLEYSMRVWINPVRMAALNITAAEIADAIEAQNVVAAAGQVGAPPFGEARTDFQLKLRAEGLLREAEEFGRIIVSTGEDGSVTRLEDVARIELGSATYAGSSQLNGQDTATIAVHQESTANALDISDSIHSLMDELSKKFPDGVSYEITYDVTDAVRVSIEDILKTLALTAGLVIAVTFFFLASFRATIVPAIAIPVSLLGAIALIYAIGFSANMITLFALVLAITLVVDDAIIIIENAERILKEDGLDPREATLKAMSQVNRPIIATTFVLAAVFVPVCFFPGVTGTIYYQFAATIIFAFVLSAVNALTLAPVLCAMVLKSGAKPIGVLRFVPAVVSWVRTQYVRLVALMLRYLAISLFVFAAAVGGTIYLFKTVPTGLIPQEDNGVLLAAMALPDGASLQRTQAFMAKAGAVIEQAPGVDTVTTVSGASMLAGGRSNAGMAIVTLKPWDQRKTPNLHWNAIMQDLDKQLATWPEAESYVFPFPTIHGLGSTGGISVELLDLEKGDGEKLESVMNAFVTALNSAPEFVRANGSFSGQTPQYRLLLDRDRAEALGVNVSDIFTALQANLSTYFVDNFILSERVYWVVISADAQYRQTLDDVGNIYVKNSAGDSLQLRNFVSSEPVLAPDSIPRYNLFTAASVSAQLAEDISSGAGIAAMQRIADKTLPDGFRIEWSGVTQEEVKSQNLVPYIMLFALVLAYLFLVVLYESWVLPLSIITSTVFALLGALIPLALFPFLTSNIFAQVGMVLLIGLAAKKAIMVVEFANQQRLSGASIRDAALKAAEIRFRPVTMTGLCFIVGVLPLVLSSGAGAAARVSIGYPVLFGMILDSTLGLLMIPVLYTAFQALREYLVRLRPRSKHA